VVQDISQQSREIFRLVVENVEDFAVFATDLKGRIVSWNPGVERLLGYAEEEFVGRHASLIFTHEAEWPARAVCEQEMETALAEGRAEDLRWHLRKDGSRVWCNGLLMLLRDEAGSPCGFAKILRDETARKQAEERLKFQANVVSMVSDAVIAVDSEERVTFWSSGAERLYGLTAGEALGRKLNDTYQYRWLSPADEEAAADSLRKTGSWFGENFHIRKDGRWIHVESLVTRLEDDDGGAVGLLAVIRDVTERKKAEQALRRSEERLRLTLESVTDYAIFTTDSSGWIETWNVGAERMFGYPEAEAVGLHVEVIFTPEDRERGVPAAEMRQARQEGRALCERWHVSKRGARFYVSGVLAALRDGPVLTGYAKIVRDLTERREAEEELRRAHEELEAQVEERTRELQELASVLLAEVKDRTAAEAQVRGLLHRIVDTQEVERRRIARDLHDDLGQRLTALQLNLESLKKKCGAQPELCEEVARTQEIVRGLDAEVDFIAWELRPAALDEVGLPMALAHFVNECSQHYRIKAEYHTAGLDGRRLAPEIEMNLYRIAQEALNNVVKHAAAGKADVLLERRDQHVVLIVEDDGAGFHPDGATDGDVGMGLLSMRERAAQLGGTLEVESEPGAGTTIYVRVPAGYADPESATPLGQRPRL
jgi:PAS domain S-box-containing protein